MYAELIIMLQYLAGWLLVLIIAGVFSYLAEQYQRRKREKIRDKLYDKVLMDYKNLK